MKFPNNWSKLFRRLRCYTSKIIESNQSDGSCLTFNCLETCLTGRKVPWGLGFRLHDCEGKSARLNGQSMNYNQTNEYAKR
ncbi:MAG: hypothetical protein ACTS4T_00955 [Candidatus Hodgkinia cicadicola]